MRQIKCPQLAGNLTNHKRQRRSYTPECRVETVDLIISAGRSNAAVAKEPGVGGQTLSTWANAEKDRLRGA